MRRTLLFVVPLVLAIAVTGFIGRATEQPIAFDHRLHVEQADLDCTDCHEYARSGVRATIPNLAICSGCHEEPQGSSPEELRLVEYIRDGTPIPWRKIYWVPDHVYFSHRRHTQIASIECQVCHGDIAAQNRPLSRRLVELSMDACMDCHQAEGVSNDCVFCHR